VAESKTLLPKAFEPQFQHHHVIPFVRDQLDIQCLLL
jgi:hypothetical protein